MSLAELYFLLKRSSRFSRFFEEMATSFKNIFLRDLIDRYADYIKELIRVKKETFSSIDEYIESFCKNLSKFGGECRGVFNSDEIFGEIKRVLGGRKRVLIYLNQELREINVLKKLIDDGFDAIPANFQEFILWKLGVENPSPYHIKIFDDKVDEETIFNFSSELKQIFDEVGVAITGADALVADTGSVILADFEGGLIRSSATPRIHIIIAGVDRFYPSLLDAWKAIYLKKIFSIYPKLAYIGVITGPSRTGDIEKVLTYGAHGPNKVIVFLLDNGRSREMGKGKENIFNCVDCTICFNTFPEVQIVSSFLGRYIGNLKELYLRSRWDKNDVFESIKAYLYSKRGEFLCPVGISIDFNYSNELIDDTLIKFLENISNFLKGVE